MPETSCHELLTEHAGALVGVMCQHWGAGNLAEPRHGIPGGAAAELSRKWGTM